MKVRRSTCRNLAVVTASLLIFVVGGHLAATSLIAEHQQRQIEELADVALRRSEAAVDFATTTLDDVIRRGLAKCDSASLQAVRLQVYQRSAVKDIRLVNRDGSVICSAYSETLEFDSGWAERSDMLRSAANDVLLFRVDQIDRTALGVLKDVDSKRSVVAILSVNASLLDTMPAELRAHSKVQLQLTNGFELGVYSQASVDTPLDGLNYKRISANHPLQITVMVDLNVLRRWNSEPYWPTLLIAAALGVLFGLVGIKTRARLEGPIADIDRGLTRHEFKPFYQPTFDLRSGKVRGCEVLARWVHADGTVVPPQSFIPLAETSGRIEALTWQILATALAELHPRLCADKYFKLSVNVVPRHLVSDGFVDTLRGVVAEANISPRQIVLEVTERSEFPDLKTAGTVIEALRELGFRVALDDVGVGHSGLSQMKSLKANIIKIDKFFVDTITEDETASTIIGTLVRLATDLRMAVIAEGIETKEQIHALLACGVGEGQGYLLSPPLPFEKFNELVKMNSPELTMWDPARVA
jgi:c-di-GMP phosphodiesterase